jgi:hypothetical protein
MKIFIKKQVKTKNLSAFSAIRSVSIFAIFVLFTMFSTKIQATTCSSSTSTAFINCLASIATSGDTIKLTGTFTLPASVTVPNKNFVLDPNGFDIMTGSTTFNTSGNPIWTVISTPDVPIVKQSTQQPLNNFTYLTSKLSLSAFLGFIQSNSVLAIEFQSFDAHSVQQGVQLNWLISEEKATEFVIERSATGKEFSPIGSINVREYAYTATSSLYSFTDQKPTAGNGYYRIKGVDLAGKTVYSKTITVTSNNKVGQVKIYPNPVGAQGSLHIETDSDIQNVVISNIFGQVVMTTQQATVNTSALAAGMYHIAIKTNDATVVKKFIKE